MPKGSLYDFLHNKQSLSWPQIWRISVDMGLGILHLHSNNILHRNLKSLNVLLDDGLRAKVCDFGLAKIKQETTTTTTSIKKSSNPIGTVSWMAPELFKRKAKYTKRSDVYSFGMILWELATRKIPWSDAQSASIIINWVLQGEKEEIPKKSPQSYAKLIAKCWEQNPKDRPTIFESLEILGSNQQEIMQYK